MSEPEIADICPECGFVGKFPRDPEDWLVCPRCSTVQLDLLGPIGDDE